MLSGTDYYPFGMAMRVGGDNKYKFGFNGQEKSDDFKGEGNSYTAEFWEYDPRIGRRWNIDPKPVIGISEYAVLRNCPLLVFDILGDTGIVRMIERRSEFMDIFDADMNWALYNLNSGLVTLEKYKGKDVFVLNFRYESDPRKQEQNRESSKRRNKGMQGNRHDRTQAHETPYAATKEGGDVRVPNFRALVSEYYNMKHGSRLKDEIKKAGISDGDPIQIVLVPDGFDEREKPPPAVLRNIKNNTGTNVQPNSQPIIRNINTNEVKEDIGRAVAITAGLYIAYTAVKWVVAIGGAAPSGGSSLLLLATP